MLLSEPSKGFGFNSLRARSNASPYLHSKSETPIFQTNFRQKRESDSKLTDWLVWMTTEVSYIHELKKIFGVTVGERSLSCAPSCHSLVSVSPARPPCATPWRSPVYLYNVPIRVLAGTVSRSSFAPRVFSIITLNALESRAREPKMP